MKVFTYLHNWIDRMNEEAAAGEWNDADAYAFVRDTIRFTIDKAFNAGLLTAYQFRKLLEKFNEI